MKDVPGAAISGVFLQSWKSLYKWIKKAIDDHRILTRLNKTSFNVTEKITEREQLLEDVIIEMNETLERRRVERQEKT